MSNEVSLEMIMEKCATEQLLNHELTKPDSDESKNYNIHSIGSNSLCDSDSNNSSLELNPEFSNSPNVSTHLDELKGIFNTEKIDQTFPSFIPHFDQNSSNSYLDEEILKKNYVLTEQNKNEILSAELNKIDKDVPFKKRRSTSFYQQQENVKEDAYCYPAQIMISVAEVEGFGIKTATERKELRDKFYMMKVEDVNHSTKQRCIQFRYDTDPSMKDVGNLLPICEELPKPELKKNGKDVPFKKRRIPISFQHHQYENREDHMKKEEDNYYPAQTMISIAELEDFNIKKPLNPPDKQETLHPLLPDFYKHLEEWKSPNLASINFC